MFFVQESMFLYHKSTLFSEIRSPIEELHTSRISDISLMSGNSIEMNEGVQILSRFSEVPVPEIDWMIGFCNETPHRRGSCV